MARFRLADHLSPFVGEYAVYLGQWRPEWAGSSTYARIVKHDGKFYMGKYVDEVQTQFAAEFDPDAFVRVPDDHVHRAVVKATWKPAEEHKIAWPPFEIPDTLTGSLPPHTADASGVAGEWFMRPINETDDFPFPHPYTQDATDVANVWSIWRLAVDWSAAADLVEAVGPDEKGVVFSAPTSEIYALPATSDAGFQRRYFGIPGGFSHWMHTSEFAQEFGGYYVIKARYLPSPSYYAGATYHGEELTFKVAESAGLEANIPAGQAMRTYSLFGSGYLADLRDEIPKHLNGGTDAIDYGFVRSVAPVLPRTQPYLTAHFTSAEGAGDVIDAPPLPERYHAARGTYDMAEAETEVIVIVSDPEGTDPPDEPDPEPERQVGFAALGGVSSGIVRRGVG
jgi:hypothetical protein